jgi:type VI secretion system Hcp family effector
MAAASLAAPALAQTAQTAPAPVMVARPAVQPATQPAGSFMKVEGIVGESHDAAHPGWIDIKSFQWEVKAAGSGAARATARDSRPTLNSLSVTKAMDKSSAALQSAASEGKHFKTVVLEFVSHTKNEHYQITMSDVLVSSFKLNAGGDRPAESITFQFAKVEMKYGSLDAQGNRGPLQAAPPTLDIRQLVAN